MPMGGAPGFDRGFDVYDAQFDVRHDRLGAAINPTFRRPGSEVVEHALAWLTQRPEGPFFLWVHLYDAHEPYDPPEPYQEHYIMHPYDGAIAYEDSVVGKLLQELKARGLYDGAMIAVMADHGESLGAHGEDTHGIFLYDETIQVPLVIKLPAGAAEDFPRGSASRTGWNWWMCCRPCCRRQAWRFGGSPRAVVAGANEVRRRRGAIPGATGRPMHRRITSPCVWMERAAIPAHGKIFVRAGARRELYDETADPKAAHNLATELKAVADTVSDRLEGFGKTSSKRGSAPGGGGSGSAAETGGAGLLVSTTAPKAAANGKEADPKDEENVETIRDCGWPTCLSKAGASPTRFRCCRNWWPGTQTRTSFLSSSATAI